MATQTQLHLDYKSTTTLSLRHDLNNADVDMRTLFSPDILTAPIPVPKKPIAKPQKKLYFTRDYFGYNTSNSSSAFSISPDAPQSLFTGSSGKDAHRLVQDDEINEGVESKRISTHRRKGSPKLLLMGQRRSGKSSIESVVFHKMAPAETLFNEATDEVKKTVTQSFTTFEIHEVPAHMTIKDFEQEDKAYFNSLGAIVWVIDVQDEYLSSIAELVKTALFLSTHNSRVNLEVLIHKADGLTEEYRYDAYREVRQRVQDELSDVGLGAFPVSFHQTSIFDHSIFEAMSKIIQKLLFQLESLEGLLNKLCSTCGMQKAFLFDTTSKLFIATDASPTFLSDYEACSDYLDVLIDLKNLYSWGKRTDASDSTDSLAMNQNLGESIVTFEQTGDTYTYAKELTEHLTLVCILGKGSGVEKRFLIDFNVNIVQDAVVQIFSLK